MENVIPESTATEVVKCTGMSVLGLGLGNDGQVLGTGLRF